MDPLKRTDSGDRARRLLAVNGVLLAVLALLVVAPPRQPALAGLQPDNNDRPRGRYTLVGGRLGSGNTDAVWLLDSVNQELLGVRWDASRARIEGLGFRSLTDDLVVREGR